MSALGLASGQKSLTVPSWHPNQRAKPPQLAPLNVDGQGLYSKPLMKDVTLYYQSTPSTMT